MIRLCSTESCIVHYIPKNSEYYALLATYPHQIKRYRSIQIRNACSMWHCALRRWRCGRVLAAQLLLLAAVLAGRSRVLAAAVLGEAGVLAVAVLLLAAA